MHRFALRAGQPSCGTTEGFSRTKGFPDRGTISVDGDQARERQGRVVAGAHPRGRPGPSP